jgi:hypothetical protein
MNACFLHNTGTHSTAGLTLPPAQEQSSHPMPKSSLLLLLACSPLPQQQGHSLRCKHFQQLNMQLACRPFSHRSAAAPSAATPG